MVRHRSATLALGGALSLVASVTACGSSSANFDDRETGTGGSSASGNSGTSGAAGTSAGSSSGGSSAGGAGGAGTSGATGGVATGGEAGGSGSSAGGAGGAGTGGSAGASGSGANAGSGGASGSGGGPLEPPPGTYGTRADLPEPNSEMAVAETNGKIYVLGGYPAGRTVQATVQVYDIASNSWSMAAPLLEAIHHPVAVGVAGKIYSLGGQIEMTGMVDTPRTTVYDPTANAWTDLAPMPTARGAGAGAAIGDKIYVAGGRPPAGNAFEVYDISENAWTALPDLPTAANDRNHIAVTAIGGKIYVAGGRYDGGSFTAPMTDRLDIYDPGTNAWTPGHALPRPRGGVNGVAAFGCFFVWGGEGQNTGEPNDVFPDHDVYDPRSNTWTSLPDLPTPVHGVTGAAFVNGLVYIPGGGTSQGGSSGSRIFQVYRPMITCE